MSHLSRNHPVPTEPGFYWGQYQCTGRDVAGDSVTRTFNRLVQVKGESPFLRAYEATDVGTWSLIPGANCRFSNFVKIEMPPDLPDATS